MKFLKLLAAVLILLGSVNGFAEEEDEDQKKITLENIVVTTPDTREHVQDIISHNQLNQPSVSDSMLNSLRNQAGVQVKMNSLGGSGGGELRIRGFSETRLSILKDGVSIQRDGSFGNGPVDWSILSSEDVERIEIHRGAGPAKFGNTFGGVVNIITKRPTAEPETKASVVYGRFDTWNSRLSHRWKAGPVGWTLAASHYETDGYLRNNSVDRDNYSAKVFLELPFGFELGAGFDYSDLETGMAVYNRPDSPYYESGDPIADEREIGGPRVGAFFINGFGDNSRVEDENYAFNGYLSKALSRGYAKLSYKLWNQERTEIFHDGADSGKKIYERESDPENDNWSLNGEVVLDFDHHKIEFGGESRHYGWGDLSMPYIDNAYLKPSPPHVTTDFKGRPDCMSYQALYVQDLWDFHPDISVELGLRGEWYEADRLDYLSETRHGGIDESNIDPRVALIYKPAGNSTITGRFGVVHRYPNSPEYYWWYLNNSTQFFNEDLDVEAARQYELSVRQVLFNEIIIVVRGYFYDIDDYIASTTVRGRGMVPYNIGDVEIKGTELAFSCPLPCDMTFWANFTWQKGDKSGDPWDKNNDLSNQLSDFPEKMFNMGLDYNYRDTINAGLSLNHVDSREHFKNQELVTLGSYTLVNVTGSWRLWENKRRQCRLLLAAENIFDQDYEEDEGYPMPGASLIGGVEFTF